MKTNIRHLIDFTKVDALLEGFNKSTGFVTAILDLDGNVLSKSGWRQICTEFHRINPETSKRCTISDTVLANKMEKGEKYHAYKCLNGLMDVAVPLKINGEHVANLFSGQFFFEKPDIAFFKKQAAAFGFDEKKYLDVLSKVPVVSEEKVKTAMDFLLNMTEFISDLAIQKLEQERITQNLKDNEQKFKSVFESANVGKSIILPSGEINVNKAFCEMLGYTRKELESKRWQGITPEEDIPISKKIFESLITGEKDSARFEKRYICKNGSYIWADVSVSIFRNEFGQPLYFITTQIDISDRKSAEQALRESEAKFFTLFEKSPFVVTLSKLPDGTFIAVNEAFEKEFGFTKQEALGKNSKDLGINPDAEDRKRILEALKESNSVRNQEMVLRSKSGEKHYYETNIDKVVINGEEYLLNTTQNISEYKRAQKKLKENYDLIRIAGEKAKLGGWNVILKENRSYWSDEVAAIHEMPAGYAPLLEDGINFYAPEWREKITEVFGKCVQQGIPYDEEMEIVTATGKRIWVRTIGEAVRDESGNIFKIQGAFQDITLKKQAEEELQKSKSSLVEYFENDISADYVVSISGEIFSCNKTFLNLFGFEKKSETEKFDITELYKNPEDRKQMIRLVRKQGKVENYELELIAKEGETIHALINAIGIFDKNDKLEKIRGYVVDITEQKKAEEKLRESETRFRKLYEDGANGMVMVNRDFKFLMANRTFCQMIGYTEEELQQLTIAQVTHPDDRANDFHNVKKMMTGEINVYRTEKRYIKKDGQTFWAQLTVSPINDSNGQFLYFVGIIVDATERKNAELDLIRMSRIMKNSQEIAHLGSFEYVADDQSTIWSEEEFRIYGLDPNGPSPEYNVMLEKCIHPDDAKLLHNTFMAAIQNHGVYELEHRIVRPDGSVRWVYDKAHPYFDEYGILLRYVGATLDITERKLAEVLLNESEKKFRNIFQNHAAVKLIIDPENGNIVDANKAAADFYGWTVETLKKMNTAQINTMSAVVLKKEMEKALAMKKTHFEFKHRKADGCQVDVEVFSSSVDIDGKQFLHSIIQDISEGKKAQEELIKNEQLLASVMDTQQELICRFLPDTTLTFVNKAYCKIFGKKEEELLGRKFLELVPESEWEDIFSYLKRLNEENSQISYENSAFKADGSVITIEWTDIAIFNEKGEVVEFQSVGRDITEKLKTLNELIVAKEKAEASDKLKTAFLNNISHEIRTPLNGILGFGQLLAESEFAAEERARIFKHVQQSGNRLMNTISDYMDMARIFSDTLEMHGKEFALQPLFEEIIENTKNLCTAKQIVFKAEILVEPVDFSIFSDPEFIRKILGKLFDNAIKFTKKGSISCGYRIKPGFVEFFVQDTGKGIAGDKLKIIFDMFSQEDFSNTRGYEGSGLGLTIAKGLVTLLGGKINVVSEKGKGSTFSFTIPLNGSGKLRSSDALTATGI